MGSRCSSLLLRKSARFVTALYDRILAPSGLSATQLPLLAALRAGVGGRGRDLADAMDLDRSTISRNLTVLEHRGLISIEPGDDRRTQQITLTDTGEEALAAAFPLWVQAQAIVASKVDADSLDEVLEKLRTRSRAVAAD